MIFKNINSEDISGLIICSEPPISSSAIRTKETTIDGRDGAIVEKLGYKTRIRNVEIGLKKDANVDKILSYFSGEGDLIFKNENDKVYKAAIYEQVDLERLLRLRKGSVAFYCQPFKYKRNDIFETIKDNKVKEKKGEYLELLNCAEQNVVDLKLEGSTSQATRDGKNLYNKRNVSGTLYKEVPINELPAGTYTLSAVATSSDTDRTQCLVLDATNNKSLGYLNRNVRSSLTFTLEKPTKKLSFYASTTYDLSKDDTFEFADIQIEQGSTATEYEQYGVSPSPDYRSPIENVEGKNKLDYKTVSNTPNTVVSLIENGFNVSGQYAGKVVINNLKKNTNYYLQYLTQNITGAVKYVAVFAGNSQTTILKEITSGVGGAFNTGENTEINIWFYGGRGANNIGEANFTNIQLEEGTVATDYVPYNSLEIKNVGENLFNPSNAKDGYVTDNSGQILGVNIKNKNTGYIKIDGEEKYFILSNKLTGNWGAWYDKDKKFISGITLGGKNKGIVTAPNNAYFINFTISYENNNPDYANNVMIARSDKEIPYKPYQEQKVDFQLSEGQKLYKNSYLASDGIHNKRKQVILDGSERWVVDKELTNTIRVYSNEFLTKGKSVNALCNYFETVSSAYTINTVDKEALMVINTTQIAVRINKTRAKTVSEFKAYLSKQYSNGTPVIVEYELAAEEIVPYTTEQQEAYNQLQKLKLYKGQNTMFSLEGSIINLKYLEDTDEKVENQGNIYSKPIIRLEKTVFKEVEIAINGIRFKYNFEEDDYVEIDCEEMTVQYEGLDRNRRLVIDFEFPKLKEGNNDIVMYSGDCIIKCKRKDRWL